MTAYDDIELDQSIEMSPDDATVFSEVPVEVAGVFNDGKKNKLEPTDATSNNLSSLTNNASGQFFRASTDKAAPPVRSRRGLKLLLVGAVVVVAASVAAYVVTSNNNKEDEANAKAASSNAARQLSSQLCVEGQVDTLKDANLELHLEGLSRPTNEKEQKVIEQAVLDAYNEVSGGCGDVYDRWVYKTTVTSQEVENLGENQTALIATVQTTISCNDCPDDETFASTYPTTLARQLMHSLTRGSGVELTEGPRVRKNRESLNRLLQASTSVDAGMVIAKIEEIIADASDKQMIEGGFSGIQKVMINNQGSSIIYASTTAEYSAPKKPEYSAPKKPKKSKSEKTSKKCKKSSKKSKKESSMPSTSASPSVSVYPSSQPSISLAPSTSVYPSSQPSVSLAPSTSVYPSSQPSTSTYSPSESVYPSLVPSTSVYPSSNPSVSLNPSMSLAPSTSASPSVSVYPSSKPSVSLAPSISVYPSSQPSVSLSPSTSVYPSSQPSTRGTYSPSESVYPSLVPSTSVYPSSNPSVSLNPSASVYPSSQPSNSIAPSCEAE